MKTSHYEQIKTNMKKKSNEELLEILEQNNHDEWTEEAFKAVHDILTERKSEVPIDLQAEPIQKAEDPSKIHGERKVIKGLILMVVGFLWIAWVVLGPLLLGVVIRFQNNKAAEALGSLTVVILFVWLGVRVFKGGYRDLRGLRKKI